MASYPISTAAIEYYTPAREQFEHLLGRLMDKETQAHEARGSGGLGESGRQ